MMSKKQKMGEEWVDAGEFEDDPRAQSFAALVDHLDQYPGEAFMLPEGVASVDFDDVFSLFDPDNGYPSAPGMAAFWKAGTVERAWTLVKLADYLRYDNNVMGYFVQAFAAMAGRNVGETIVERWLAPNPFNYYSCRMFYQSMEKFGSVALSAVVPPLCEESRRKIDGYLVEAVFKVYRISVFDARWTMQPNGSFESHDRAAEGGWLVFNPYAIAPKIHHPDPATNQAIVDYQVCAFPLFKLVACSAVLFRYGADAGFFVSAIRAKMKMLKSWFEPADCWKMTQDTPLGIVTILADDGEDDDSTKSTLHIASSDVNHIRTAFHETRMMCRNTFATSAEYEGFDCVVVDARKNTVLMRGNWNRFI